MPVKIACNMYQIFVFVSLFSFPDTKRKRKGEKRGENCGRVGGRREREK